MRNLGFALPLISKLIGLTSVGSSLARVTLMHRFLSGITSIIAFTVLSSLMAGMLIVCGFYGLYMGMVQYGMEHTTALLTLALIMFCLMGTLSYMAYIRLQELRDLPRSMMRQEIPGFTKVGGVVNAFLEGFNEPRTRY